MWQISVGNQTYKQYINSIFFLQMQFIPPLSDGYTIYTKSGCKWCVHAKRFFTEAKIINCDQLLREDRDDFLAKMDEYTSGHRSFPMVFNNNEFIGGYHESIKRVMTDILLQ